MSGTEPQNQPKKRGGRFGIVGAALILISKFKWVIFGAFKFLKMGATFWSMLLMMWAYSVRLGWPYSVGFVLLILVHELGHGYAARRLGLAVGAPVFIPFIGAFIALKDRPKSTYQNFVIGAGGPLAGTAGAVVCLGLSAVLPGVFSQLFFALAYSAFILNLFNLMPIGFLDGGRMSAPIALGQWVAGWLLLAGGVAYAITHLYWTPQPIAMIVLLLGLVQLFLKIGKARRSEKAVAAQSLGEGVPTAPVPANDFESLTATLVYFGLAALLIFLVHYFQPYRHGASLPIVE
ncbi:MAG: site-2 protease family protein [Deltaproteobacteria bacterium]|nr:site-2 protease family protein [Deltaproteobacteria bacterium]